MTKSMQIPLSKPALLDADLESANEVLKSGQLISGRTVETFERLLATYVKTRYAVCVSSGTAALHLGLLALGIGPGDDVIVPAFSYPASANAVEMVSAKPVFVDSESGGFNIDTSRIENNITSRTKAVMIVHNFGCPVDINRIHALSAKYNIPIIEDAACGLGSTTNGTKCGNLGRMAIFSFHPRKILTTGEGGAVVTNDLELAEKIKKLRNHGQDFSSGVDFVMPGLNYRMTEFQAALGVSQMKRYDSILRERARAAAFYNDRLPAFDFLRLCRADQNKIQNYQTYVAFVADGLRNRLIDHLKIHGVEAGIGTYSIPHTTLYSGKYGFGDRRFPESLNAYRNIISLPLYNGIAREEQNYIIDILNKFKAEDREIRQAETVETTSKGRNE